MATYKEIQAYIKKQNGFVVKSCWIAHIKDICGLSPKISPNRRDVNVRQIPCPDEKIEIIKAAFRHFKMI